MGPRVSENDANVRKNEDLLTSVRSGMSWLRSFPRVLHDGVVSLKYGTPYLAGTKRLDIMAVLMKIAEGRRQLQKSVSHL